MATVNALRQLRFGNRGAIFTWSAIPTGDEGDAQETIDLADRSVAFTGTFGGATVVLQGSNDGANWFTLTDPFGNAISRTTAGLVQVLEFTRFVRPAVSGGSGAAITVVLMALGTGR